ncbi:MAG: carboxylate-amine ligase [Pseudomonadota bacterium]
MPEPSFTLGIEEEYLLVDLETRDLATDPPPELLDACQSVMPDQVAPEFLKCQIEVGTPVCGTLAEARERLATLRSTIAAVAAGYGLAPIAASTHPFANWRDQRHTERERYNKLAADMQVVIRRMLICGMHVHVAIEDEDLRIDLFNQLIYFLPHLLALSTSSPFWQGHNTGLKSYRLSVFNEMPRTGVPGQFSSAGEYHRTVDTLVTAGVIEDATKIWWDLRPSARFPTLEMRITDVCTKLDDALSIAALYLCLARMLWRLRRSNQRWRFYSPFLVNENRWLAQKSGASGHLIDFGKSASVPFPDLLDELLDLVTEDAEALGCLAAIEHTRAIASHGTSADRQERVYAARVTAGDDHETALKAVVDHLIEETLEGTR